MGDLSKAENISDILDRLFVGKSAGGEYVTVCDEHLILTRVECPEILLAVNNAPEIILAQQFSKHSKRILSMDDKAIIANELKSSTPAQKRIFSDDLDITGSPLKCPFSMNEDVSELSPFSISLPPSKKKNRSGSTISCTPISASKARLVASKLNLALKTIKDIPERTSLWVVCDGKDEQGTLFYGLHHDGETSYRMIVTSSGPIDNFDTLTLDHLKAHHVAASPTKMVDSSVKATYSILASEDESENSSLQLTSCWTRPLKMLAPPSLDGQTTASLKIVCSDKRSAAHQMYQEWSVLRGFVTGLSTGEVSWFVREGPQSVAEDIEKVFNTIREKGQRQKNDEEAVSNFDMMVENKFYNRRQNMDFMDLLWNVLMRCESYSDLKQNLDLVFETIANGQVRPQIHVRNKTQIGMLARGLMRGQVDLPNLSGITPLQMLIEIGIEKIKRDYISIFQTGELVTSDQLSWFVNNEGSFETMAALLEKMHVGLQVCVILHTYLSLPQASLAHFTAQALGELQKENDGVPYTFSFEVKTISVHKLLNSLRPTSWEVKLDSSHEKYSKSLIYHVSRTPLINFGADFEELLEDNEKDSSLEEEEKYYCCCFTTVKDKTFL